MSVLLFTSIVALFCATVNASISKVCPGPDSNVCFSLNVPDTTLDSGSGDVFFQLSAPSTYSWIGLGQGAGIIGTNIFVVYRSADDNNLTVSTRIGGGHGEPMYHPGAQVTLLEGSGIVGDEFIANLRCSNCEKWDAGSMDFRDAYTPWVFAALKAPPIYTDDVEERLMIHSFYGLFQWDMTAAKGGQDANPFLDTDTRSLPIQSVRKLVAYRTPSNTPYLVAVHGVLAILAFVVIFPTGGILIRVVKFSGIQGWKVHAAVQTFGYLVYTVAFAMGVYLATILNVGHNKHPIAGTVAFALILLQPLSGLRHHAVFVKIKGRGAWSWLHLMSGRLSIAVGMVNGAWGLLLTNVPRRFIIAYAVVASIFGAAYVAAIVVGEMRRRKSRQESPPPDQTAESDEKPRVDSVSSDV